MRKWNVALVALAAGAGAVYFLDPRQGARRREALAERWRSGTLLDDARTWLAQRLGQRPVIEEDDGLEPLSMAPAPLEEAAPHKSRVLPALALAAPVAVAVGAAVLQRYRREEGDWLH